MNHPSCYQFTSILFCLCDLLSLDCINARTKQDTPLISSEVIIFYIFTTVRISIAVTLEIAGINSEHTKVVGLKPVALVWLRGRCINLPDGLSGFFLLHSLRDYTLGRLLVKMLLGSYYITSLNLMLQVYFMILLAGHVYDKIITMGFQAHVRVSRNSLRVL